ncbi:LysE family transporter [Streptomyces sp. NPDC096033]|uniref:LysE family transporter n=1 Tax=Streptomyces sp. NPDC096033 TaxID=3366071 RepID=UPI00381893C0
MTEPLLAGLLAGYGIAMPVGAMSVLIVTLSSRVSLRRGLAAALGVATADGLYALAAVAGGAALTRILAPAASALQATAALVLAAIAVRGLAVAVRAHPAGRPAPPPMADTSLLRTYTGLLGLTLLNPVTLVYFGALVIGNQSEAGGSTGGRVLFVVAAFAASASWQALLASGGAFLGRVLTGNRGRTLTAVTGNTVILLLAARLAWSAATG